jgi:hypothetical protein
MQIPIGVCLIVAGVALIGAGVGVLCWHDVEDADAIPPADGWGFSTVHLAQVDPEDWSEE